MRTATGAAVRAQGLALRGAHGWVFAGLDLAAAPGSVTALVADAGGGRTSALLALSGRMRPTGGSLEVDGYRAYRKAGADRQIRRICALGLCAGLNDLDERLRVGEHLTERRLMRLKPSPRGLAGAALEAAGLSTGDSSRRVHSMSLVERRKLGLALALTDEPRIVLADDVDRGLGPESRAEFWAVLRGLAGRGLTVLASCADAAAAEDEGGAAVVELGQDAPPGAGRPAVRIRLGELLVVRAGGKRKT